VTNVVFIQVGFPQDNFAATADWCLHLHDDRSSRHFRLRYALLNGGLMHSANKLRFLLIFGLLSLSCGAYAQEEAPKADVFVGYQWLDPGATVPTSPTNALTGGENLPSMTKGLGGTATVNFSKLFGLSFDAGGNWHDIGHEITLSVGPRFVWRGEDANFFAHTMIGLNQLKAGSLDSRNSLGAILGGGMDLRLGRGIYWRVFEADYVWAAVHYSDVVPTTQPNLRRPYLEGARLRTGLVFSIAGTKPEPF